MFIGLTALFLGWAWYDKLKPRKAEVTFDRSKTTIEELATVIKSNVGFTVTGHEILIQAN